MFLQFGHTTASRCVSGSMRGFLELGVTPHLALTEPLRMRATHIGSRLQQVVPVNLVPAAAYGW